jgi:hypothetical protein
MSNMNKTILVMFRLASSALFILFKANDGARALLLPKIKKTTL